MPASFDDHIKAKGIVESEHYSIGQVAGILELHHRTVYNYCYVGMRTRGNGVINLPTFRNGTRWEILGKDLIEFLRAVQSEH
jgi:hypothetical protein